jgi:Zn-dependent alcohol dehydrogenase
MYSRTPHELARALRPYIAGKKVCDLGCDVGEFMKALATEAREVVGIEQVTAKQVIASDQGFTVINDDFSRLDQDLPDAEVYYAFITTGALERLLAKIIARDIKSVFIIGIPGPWAELYLKEIGAVEIKIANDHFNAMIWTRT